MKKVKFFRSEIVDLYELDPSKDGSFTDWQLIHIIKNNENKLTFNKEAFLNIARNMTNIYTDQNFNEKIEVMEGSIGIKINKQSEGIEAVPTIDGNLLETIHSLKTKQ